MKYIIQHGKLKDLEGKTLLCSSAHGSKRTIQDSQTVIETRIEDDNGSRCYVASDEKTVIARLHPLFSRKDDPSLYGWPVNRMPVLDRAEGVLKGKSVVLRRDKADEYSLVENGESVARIRHRGIAGGWDVTGTLSQDDAMIFYVFARYLEKDNELPVI